MTIHGDFIAIPSAKLQVSLAETSWGMQDARSRTLADKTTRKLMLLVLSSLNCEGDALHYEKTGRGKLRESKS